MVKETIMEEHTMLTGAFEPASDRSLTMTGTTYKDRYITAFGQKHQNQHDTILSGFQAIQGSVKTAGKAFIAPLAFPVLNVFVDTTVAIPAALLGDAIPGNSV
jgi:hypothetical protein